MATDLVLAVGKELQLLIASEMKCDLRHSQLRFDALVGAATEACVKDADLVTTMFPPGM